jgi:serine-type D-Ala-D-Ala carboxypeptidase/endopeptidase
MPTILKVTGFALLALVAARTALPAQTLDAKMASRVEAIMEQWRLDAHVPGLVYGIVKDGELIAVKGLGVQDVVTKRAVDPDSLFRIASMSKAFTALAVLKLRDAGKLSLDALAEDYVPEMRGWSYPTRDSRKIRVRDLLNHVAGFATDDPWGDRHQPFTETQFSKLLQTGVPFSRQPGITMEYSNFGYATLGRIIANVSGTRYQDYIRANFFKPLGMSSTGYDVFSSPVARRAIGYRWQDDDWLREPDMADGTFGAMGGIETSAKDYALWVGFLLSAWPPRDAIDSGPVPRATVREIVEGSNFPAAGMRDPKAGGAPCRQARSYAMGWYVMDDCDLGRMLTHSGGYPGYGSRVLLFPDKGLGIFVLTNRTYAGPNLPALKAALALQATNAFPDRPTQVSKGVAAGYEIVRSIWSAGTVSITKALALNFLLDRDEVHWARELARLKAQVGACAASEDVSALTAMQGKFAWTCEHGRIEGTFLLAPEGQLELQSLEYAVMQP